jgi:tRNA-splicing ligase RtcB
VEIIYKNDNLMKLLGSNNNIPVFGDPLQNAVDQMSNCLVKGGYKAALMADHHLGYAVPVGGVIAYKDKISPSGVGFDIGCGNKAVMTDLHYGDIAGDMNRIMDEVFDRISFGIGRKNKTDVDHALFDNDAWTDIAMLGELKDMARGQLGTVGSGNHYVDIFYDQKGRVWIGVHFGSRGLGHKIASHYIKAGGGVDGINVDPAILDVNTDLGREYIAAMNLAGEYAYAGRDWVCEEVARILGASILDSVHNHHNFAWNETHDGEDLWVVRKGATPAFPGQRGFVGGTMGENSVILEGVASDLSSSTLFSTVHGAGRVMSRTEAAGKSKWKGGKKIKISEGKVSQAMMDEWVNKAGVVLRGAGVDESPHAYKRLADVLEAQGDTVRILDVLTPIGVAMAGADVFDPYAD